MAVAGVTAFLERQAGRMRGLPRGVRIVLGLVPIVVGVLVLVRPFDSLWLLLALLAVALVLDGVARVARAGEAPRPVVAIAAAVAEVVGGVLVVVWPFLSVAALAVVVGVVLVVNGVADLSAAVTGSRGRRLAHGLHGAALVIFGALAIAWPDVSLLVIAVVFAARLVAFGVGVIARAVRRPAEGPRREPGRWARGVDLTARALLLVLAVAALAGSAYLHRSASAPTAFYDPPASVPAEPGRLIRSEPYARAVPEGARGWLILYTTTDAHGDPTAGSAFVMAPDEPSDAPRDVVLWTHGTQGADRTCAPTLLPEPLPIVEPVAAQLEQLARGRVLVGPDYPGMGTPGPQGYLVGEAEGRSSLDAVRAAHELAGLELSWRTVVWGHSQGGQAALWTGGLAASYAPEVELLGVSAAAPAADVKGLIASLGTSLMGQVLGPLAVRAYSETYDDVRARDYVDPRMWAVYEAASRRCLPHADTLVTLVTALTMRGEMYRADPASGPLGDRLDENLPTRPIDAPLFIAQGAADPLILPEVQRDFVAGRCAAGQAMVYREYEGRDHLGVVADDSPYSADLLDWTEDRFAGRPQTEDTCP